MSAWDKIKRAWNGPPAHEQADFERRKKADELTKAAQRDRRRELQARQLDERAHIVETLRDTFGVVVDADAKRSQVQGWLEPEGIGPGDHYQWIVSLGSSRRAPIGILRFTLGDETDDGLRDCLVTGRPQDGDPVLTNKADLAAWLTLRSSAATT